MTMKLSTREDFDFGTCQEPGCGCGGNEVYIAPKCHDGAGLYVCYVKDEGALRLECAECGQPIARVAVAGRAAQSALKQNVNRRAKKRRLSAVPLTEFTYVNGYVRNGQWISHKPSAGQAREALLELARKGLVVDSGRRRNGEIVWIAAEVLRRRTH
jgi:hypothetical protein